MCVCGRGEGCGGGVRWSATLANKVRICVCRVLKETDEAAEVEGFLLFLIPVFVQNAATRSFDLPLLFTRRHPVSGPGVH